MFKSYSSISSAKVKVGILSDLSAGFYVFLLALPLSLGIAEASGFPAVMGLITAAVGGLVTSWFTGSPLSIKGPAAGLIVIVLGAVTELGAHDHSQGWIMALLAIFTAGVFQILFGIFKWGKYVNLIPSSSIQGMLAAIGIVILSKQLYIMTGIPAVDENGKAIAKPLMLLWNFTQSLSHIQWFVFIIGLISLILVWSWTFVQNPLLKSIPSPLLVLMIAIPLSYLFEISENYKLGFHFKIDELFQWRLVFKEPISWFVFGKYVALFALIGSLESLLTLNAIEPMKPEYSADKDKDLIAIGIGNMFSSAIGGLPMISEVARSTANVQNGALSTKSNFFHGAFILLFLFFSTYFNHIIPLSALAAMLVLVGIRLANPKVILELKRQGWGPISAFLATLVGSLAIDLLWGLVLGTVLKICVEKLQVKTKNP